MERRGFTLIELLVVIAIIAILAAILFPIFISAKAKARQAQCISNMGQIGKAVLAYADTWNGMYPPNRFEAKPAAHNWKHAIKSFLSSKSIFICPSNDAYWQPKRGASKMDESGAFAISYGYNGLMFYEGFLNWAGRRMSQISDSRRTIYILETRETSPDLGPWMLNYDDSITDMHQYDSSRGMGFFQIHTSKRANWLFCDCHAASLTIAQTCVPKNMWGTDSYRGPGNYHSYMQQSFYDYMVSGKHLAPEYY